MANTLTPAVTNLAASGKTITITSSLEYDAGDPNNSSDRTPLINMLQSAVAFDQAIPFALDVAASAVEQNLWEAPSVDLRARAVIVTCDYGGGGIGINAATGATPFALTAGAFFVYINTGDGPTVEIASTPTDIGDGIDSVWVSTENESRFRGYIFI